MMRYVLIRDNDFAETGASVILIAPENDLDESHVHRNIRIENNRFRLRAVDVASVKPVDGLVVRDNLFLTCEVHGMEELIKAKECKDVVAEGNMVTGVGGAS